MNRPTYHPDLFIENGRTYLPLRFITETLGANVEWIDETQQIIITCETDE